MTSPFDTTDFARPSLNVDYVGLRLWAELPFDRIMPRRAEIDTPRAIAETAKGEYQVLDIDAVDTIIHSEIDPDRYVIQKAEVLTPKKGENETPVRLDLWWANLKLVEWKNKKGKVVLKLAFKEEVDDDKVTDIIIGDNNKEETPVTTSPVTTTLEDNKVDVPKEVNDDKESEGSPSPGSNDTTPDLTRQSTIASFSSFDTPGESVNSGESSPDPTKATQEAQTPEESVNEASNKLQDITMTDDNQAGPSSGFKYERQNNGLFNFEAGARDGPLHSRDAVFIKISKAKHAGAK